MIINFFQESDFHYFLILLQFIMTQFGLSFICRHLFHAFTHKLMTFFCPPCFWRHLFYTFIHKLMNNITRGADFSAPITYSTIMISKQNISPSLVIVIWTPHTSKTSLSISGKFITLSKAFCTSLVITLFGSFA